MQTFLPDCATLLLINTGHSVIKLLDSQACAAAVAAAGLQRLQCPAQASSLRRSSRALLQPPVKPWPSCSLILR